MAGHETQALWALAAGELDAGARARVEAHLQACASCAEESKRVTEARALLHTARAVEPAVRWEETGAKLKAAAAKRLAQPERRFLSPWALTLAGACAVALVLWLGGSLLRKNVGGEVPVVANRAARDAEVPAVPATGPAPAPVVAPKAPPAAPEAVAAREAATEAERVSGAVMREATGSEQALAPGMRLRSGVAVRTPAKASAVLRLPDASRVRLSAGSDVVFARAETNAVHLTVQQGRLSVSASHARREGFLVESAGLRVSVVGTVFSVERTAGGAAVAVLEGRVRVDAEGQPTRFVNAGERVELAEAGGALKPRALSAGDRQAFRDLRAAEPRPEVASVAPAPKGPARNGAAPGLQDAPQDTVVATRPPAASANSAASLPSIATAANPLESAAQDPRDMLPVDNDKSLPSVATAANGLEPPVPAPEAMPSQDGTAVAATPAGPSEDFAPYPGSTGDALASSAPLAMPGSVQAPSVAPVIPAPPRQRKTLGMLVPGGLLSDDSDERFLGYAKVQMQGSTCGRFLVGLGEIAAASPRANHREDARVLRGRCFTKQRQPAAAEDEYRQYLREYPNGRYATEARTALGMSAAPGPEAPTNAPAPLPRPVPITPRWGSPGGAVSPQRAPVSPGAPRRW
ncbi:FecR domain-containing protein [Corallococcus llansteffanensis]|uniref:VgrG protein n=1 Tax=Corallococcus llansteffanensis TaxID=2316731 RepID=A0A3A8PW73_9BACT|nr:FecR domain-containing protein [Corallococcus llansteffanensis]RKH56622.1 VgrG protein [Corallococcus llansteffanensis]